MRQSEKRETGDDSTTSSGVAEHRTAERG